MSIQGTILVEKRNVYGVERIYVLGEHEIPLKSLTRKETLDSRDVENLRKLGFSFQVKTPTL